MQNYDILLATASKALEIKRKLISVNLMQDHTYIQQVPEMQWVNGAYVKTGVTLNEKVKMYSVVIHKHDEQTTTGDNRTTLFKSLPFRTHALDQLCSAELSEIIDQMYRNTGSPVI